MRPADPETSKPSAARASRVAQLGGPVNAGLATAWLVCALIGWVLTMAGLSALQNYVNSSTYPRTVPTWWGEANFARLGGGTVFRFQWWTWAWTAVTIVTAALAFASGVVAQARLPLVAWFTITAVLTMISANSMLDYVAQHVSPADTSAARTAAAGYIITAISALCASYSIGLFPHNA